MNISRNAIGYAQKLEVLFTGNETFIRTEKNQIFQIGGISYTDSSPLGYVRELKCFRDRNIAKMSHWAHRELEKILFCTSITDSSLYYYNIESETLNQIKFSKFSIHDFGIMQSKNDYQWWATSLNGEIYRAQKLKGNSMPTEWQF